MKLKNLTFCAIGLVIMLSSVWLGAYGQELTSLPSCYYAQPAFFTAVVGFVLGLGLIIFGGILTALAN